MFADTSRAPPVAASLSTTVTACTTDRTPIAHVHTLPAFARRPLTGRTRVVQITEPSSELERHAAVEERDIDQADLCRHREGISEPEVCTALNAEAGVGVGLRHACGSA
jgi:hypothetical protein